MKRPPLPLLLAATLLAGGLGGYALSVRGPLPGASSPHAHAPGTEADQAPASASPERAAPGTDKPVYTCPMHPQVISDHPGSCPICGMDLVAKTAPVDGAEAPAGVAEIALSPRQLVLANVATTPVSKRALAPAVAATGQVVPDETRLKRQSAWIDGRIERLMVASTGQAVRQGQVVATIYSPELVAAQQEYLSALDNARELGRSEDAGLAENARTLLSASRQRLRLLGLSAAQLGTLERTRQTTLAVPVLATATGTVLTRQVQAGQYVKAGDPLFDLVDLSRVWVEADVFEPDLASIRPGGAAEVRFTARPDAVTRGRVAFIQPIVTAESRTAKVRIELPNPDGALRPAMYATVRFPAAAGDTLAVPASAIVDAGRRQLVYVERGPGRFEPRAVELGARADGWVGVARGLKAGEKVATTGAFLLDAGAQLAAPDEAHTGHAHD